MPFPVNSPKPILASSHLLDKRVGGSVLPQAWVGHSFSLLCAGPGAGPPAVLGLPGFLAHQAGPLWPPTPEKPAGGFSFTPRLFPLLLPSLQACNQAVFSPQGRASHFSILNSLDGFKILWFCRLSGYVPLLGWVWLSPVIFYTNQKGQPSSSTSNIYIIHFLYKKIIFFFIFLPVAAVTQEHREHSEKRVLQNTFSKSCSLPPQHCLSPWCELPSGGEYFASPWNRYSYSVESGRFRDK